MVAEYRTGPGSRVAAWLVASLFILGFFSSAVGMWTGAILAVWFVGTQPPLRGFLLQIVFVFVPALCTHWRNFPVSSAQAALAHIGWLAAGAILAVLPFLFYRLVSIRLSDLAASFALPAAGAAVQQIARWHLPRQTFELYYPPAGSGFDAALRWVFPALPHGVAFFLVLWFAALVLWFWNHEFRAPARVAAIPVALLCLLTVGNRLENLPGLPSALGPDGGFALLCGVAGLVLACCAAIAHRHRPRPWASRGEILRVLRSPASGQPLTVTAEGKHETLVSPAGERFPIRDGIAVVHRPEDLIGLNGKYNRLYQIIGGFYDDSQRVVCALAGIDRDAYVKSYLKLLEVKSGDSVLETSVGTGLNFKYLPRGVRLCGLDLSPAMLTQCRQNLHHWGLEADLFLGNAESLPFADSSFDVVFHVGGINFFNDRAKAIREMVRVAKPGSRILIADETEEHVKSNYEKFPITGEFFKNRAEAVAAPVDLVPAEMEEIHLEELKPVGKNRFYVLTFRKPAGDGSGLSGATAELQAASL